MEETPSNPLDPQKDTTPTKIFTFKSTKNSKDALVNFSVNNPIPPLKRLAKKLLGNEEITIKIPVLTAIAIVAFGLGGASGFITAIKSKIAAKVPIVQTIFPTESPKMTPNPWIQEILFGTLTKQSTNFYLVLESGDVIRLQIPDNVDLNKLVGKKILAQGKYNIDERTMEVEIASDLILFSSTAPVPTHAPTPRPQESITPTPSLTPEPTL